jgi:hypothetical protein
VNVSRKGQSVCSTWVRALSFGAERFFLVAQSFFLDPSESRTEYVLEGSVVLSACVRHGGESVSVRLGCKPLVFLQRFLVQVFILLTVDKLA